MNRAMIVTDLEGISCVDSIRAIYGARDETGAKMEDAAAYRHACERLMADTNAAVRGALAGGAETVYVWDGHGGGNNFIPELLDGRAVQVDGSTVMDIIGDCDALLCVGMHAKAGTPRAFLDHTQSSASIFDYRYNGISSGEITQECLFAGWFGIPCVALTGDRAACEEAGNVCPGVYTAEVKAAEVRNSAVCVDAQTAEARIFEAAKAGYEHRRDFAPFTVSWPLEIEVTYLRTDFCDAILRWRQDARRVDGRTLARTSNEIKSYMDILI
ncbi:MAG: M55 family metallopeptidase [Clostridia bacterium]|nr:M55 family metallopeptidase [Clostridia bacterium]